MAADLEALSVSVMILVAGMISAVSFSTAVQSFVSVTVVAVPSGAPPSRLTLFAVRMPWLRTLPF